MKRAAQLFALQFISYFLIVANTRAYTQGLYLATAVTDILFAAQNFLAIKLVSDRETYKDWRSWVGYILGGTIGGLVSIFVTKIVLGR